MKSYFMNYDFLENDQIKFLYKFVPGTTPKSFGIIVAK